jgi:hypothetical protein
MKIPAGTTLYIGPPANPMPAERQEQIRSAVIGIAGVVEAHLPQCFAKGLVDPSAQVLVLVLAEGVLDTDVVPKVEHRLLTALPQGSFVDILPLRDGAPFLNTIRATDCKLSLFEVQ